MHGIGTKTSHTDVYNGEFLKNKKYGFGTLKLLSGEI